MDTLIERKKRFTPKQIYGGAGVLLTKAVSLSLQLQKMSLMIISA